MANNKLNLGLQSPNNKNVLNRKCLLYQLTMMIVLISRVVYLCNKYDMFISEDHNISVKMF